MALLGVIGLLICVASATSEEPWSPVRPLHYNGHRDPKVSQRVICLARKENIEVAFVVRRHNPGLFRAGPVFALDAATSTTTAAMPYMFGQS